MNIKTIGLDIAKNVFQIHGADVHGKGVLKKQLKRPQVLAFFANLTPCLVGLEACAGAHYWARELIKLGHDARLISPQFVKPYVKGNKNDANDAEAICEITGVREKLNYWINASLIFSNLSLLCPQLFPIAIAEFSDYERPYCAKPLDGVQPFETFAGIIENLGKP